MMATDVVDDREMREAQRDYLDFLDDDQDQGIYQSKVRDMISENKARLIVNVNDLRRRNEARAAKLMNNAFEELLAFQRALKDLAASVDATYAKQHEEFYIGLEGSFGSKHVTPRTLTSRLLGSMVCVEGIITKCERIGSFLPSVASFASCAASTTAPPRRRRWKGKFTVFNSCPSAPQDEENNPLETEFGLSIYKDHQTITVQEMPEKAPAGQLPRSVDIILDNDLVDMVKPGDRVQVVGTYRCLPSKKGGFTSGTFRTIMIACNVKQMSKEVSPHFSGDDVAKIRNFSRARSKDVFDQLARSLAPSIHGHDYIKKAILCMLLGGVEKVLENGSRIRGDINILLIGDPSVAKSQLLRYVLHTAPRAIPTTGRGSTGVGLTAAVTTDQETGERRLEAGAMVLADRGVVCIDEFDKMSDMDRTAIHEVMEQGRVTIAKAGIHARLNARCSVLAAANPVYGRYNQYKTPMENIGLQDSLLSRFDLLFIMLDQMDPEQDREISDHVLRMHRYRDPREQEGAAMSLGGTVDVLATDDPDAVAEEHEELQIYEKHNNLLHGSKKKKEKVVSKEFMRKYIHIAKAVTPVLTEEAANHIAEEYSRLRSQEQMGADIARTSPVTARTLETLIRLSTAHAKARMSKAVELEDSEVAVELVQFAYFKKVGLAEEEKLMVLVTEYSGLSDVIVWGFLCRSWRKRRNARGRRRTLGTRRRTRRKSHHHGAWNCAHCVFSHRLKEFKSSLFAVFQSAHAQSVKMSALMDDINKGRQKRFTEPEVRAALARMQDDNQVMLADDIVFLI
uniref:DNA replication licensing factor MCM3 n=1 Tax=Mola mola TaxID=94237 RepID=A0A3Q3X459_MOLML